MRSLSASRESTGEILRRPHRRLGARAADDAQLERMLKAAEPLLSGGGRQAYWTARWQSQVEQAGRSVDSNRRKFYYMQAVAVCASVIVPSLVGLNLSDVGGEIVRWLTFGLSLIAA